MNAKTNPTKSPKSVPSRDDLLNDCREIVESGDALRKAEERLHGCGYSGDTRLIKLLLLASVTRLFDKPVSMLILGESSTGKSHSLKTFMAFLPSGAYVLRSGASKMAMVYSNEDYRHKDLIIEELAGLSGGNVWLRTLLSEGKINYETVDSNLNSKKIIKEGPCGLIATTTQQAVYHEDATRYLSWEIQDDLGQLGATTKGIAEEAEGKSQASYDFPDWSTFGTWLEMGPRIVVIPFATKLDSLIPKVANRQRRDFGQLISLIKAHALMNQRNRATDDQGRIVATVDDYGAVRELVVDILGQAIKATVPATIKEVHDVVTSVTAHRSEYKDGVPLKVVAAKINRDKGAASRRVDQAVEWGFVADEGEGAGFPRKLKPGMDIPESREVLPSVEALKTAMKGGEVGAP